MSNVFGGLLCATASEAERTRTNKSTVVLSIRVLLIRILRPHHSHTGPSNSDSPTSYTWYSGQDHEAGSGNFRSTSAVRVIKNGKPTLSGQFFSVVILHESRHTLPQQHVAVPHYLRAATDGSRLMLIKPDCWR